MSFVNFMRKLDGKPAVPEKKRSWAGNPNSSNPMYNLQSDYGPQPAPSHFDLLDDTLGVEEEDWDYDDPEDIEYEPSDQESGEQGTVPAVSHYGPTITTIGWPYHIIYYTDGTTSFSYGTSPNDTPDGESVPPSF